LMLFACDQPSGQSDLSKKAPPSLGAIAEVDGSDDTKKEGKKPQAGTEQTPRVQFGAATAGASFYYAYAANGDPETSPNAAAVISSLGTRYGQVTATSADALGNIGSPGTATAIPEPATGALLGLGAVGLFGYLRRIRRNRG